jgi:hypothetical protein
VKEKNMPDRKEFPGRHFIADDLSADFESEVFRKIKKKKKVKKVTYAVLTMVTTGIAVVAFQVLSGRAHPPQPLLVESVSSFKEEIPLQENLYFASSDRQTQYSIEQISYQKSGEQDQGI